MALAGLAGVSHGQISDNNQISGDIGFSNTNPVILDILDGAGLDQGIWRADINATSVGSPTFGNSTNAYPDATEGVLTPYTINVQGGEAGAGIEYTVKATTHGSTAPARGITPRRSTPRRPTSRRSRPRA